MELGHISLYHLQYAPAKVYKLSVRIRSSLFLLQVYFENALQVSCISTELTGVLGKRTRFQQTDVAQLMLKVSTSSTHSPESTPHSPESTHSPDPQREGGREFPREVSLDDDTVLDKIHFTQPQNLECLSSLQQAALLGWW